MQNLTKSVYVEKFKKFIEYGDCGDNSLCGLRCELRRGSICMCYFKLLENWTVMPNGLGTFKKICNEYTEQKCNATL
jgi:hypothetical protein